MTIEKKNAIKTFDETDISVSSSKKSCPPSDFSLKIKAIEIPTISDRPTAEITLAKPIENPKTLNVRKIAAIFIAGPENKKVIAGPRPAPLFLIDANNGKIVQEQTASIEPDIEAIE